MSNCSKVVYILGTETLTPEDVTSALRLTKEDLDNFGCTLMKLPSDIIPHFLKDNAIPATPYMCGRKFDEQFFLTITLHDSKDGTSCSDIATAISRFATKYEILHETIHFTPMGNKTWSYLQQISMPNKDEVLCEKVKNGFLHLSKEVFGQINPAYSQSFVQNEKDILCTASAFDGDDALTCAIVVENTDSLKNSYISKLGLLNDDGFVDFTRFTEMMLSFNVADEADKSVSDNWPVMFNLVSIPERVLANKLKELKALSGEPKFFDCTVSSLSYREIVRELTENGFMYEPVSYGPSHSGRTTLIKIFRKTIDELSEANKELANKESAAFLEILYKAISEDEDGFCIREQFNVNADNVPGHYVDVIFPPDINERLTKDVLGGKAGDIINVVKPSAISAKLTCDVLVGNTSVRLVLDELGLGLDYDADPEFTYAISQVCTKLDIL